MDYYLERRDPEFKQKMAQVLCVYREAEILREAAGAEMPSEAGVIVSYDESRAIGRSGPPRRICRQSRVFPL